MTAQSPRVTIGVPVYNGERYLGACLDSLLAQTFTDFTVIVCDNASTDRTAEIARDYGARDSRVRYHRNSTNIGCPRNFVRVFELSDTPYFRWASADDQSAPEFVERCMDVLDRRADVVQAYPRTLLIDAAGRIIRKYEDGVCSDAESPYDRYRHVTESIGLCNAVYGVIRSDVLRRTGILGAYIGSDVVLQEELALHGKILELPEYLLLRRMHPEAQSAMSDAARTAHYDPASTSRKSSSPWRHLWERTQVVKRAPIAITEKARIMSYLARKAIMSRERYGRELMTNARRLLRLA
jgi:glycosyltransferase involved in cell wall biosynthesis